MQKLFFLASLLLCLGAAPALIAQETYFVTYSHEMEEPGNLELESKWVSGSPQHAHSFVASATELEYGVRAWWTSELYLDGQTTAGESTVFTGYRFENRFRLLPREHWINPVLYTEFANINGADKTLLEVVGHDGRQDFLTRNSRSEKVREAEFKLIFSSNVKAWNISENIIAEKNLKAAPWEFGYAIGVSRPLALAARAEECRLCAENFSLGAELYGGLGERYSFGLRHTSHYLAPVASFRVPNGPTLKISPAVGLNDYSHGALLRFAVSYEIEQIAAKLRGR